MQENYICLLYLHMLNANASNQFGGNIFMFMYTSICMTIVSTFISSALNVIYETLMILLSFIGIHHFILSGSDCEYAGHIVRKRGTSLKNNKKYGFTFGFPYVGYWGIDKHDRYGAMTDILHIITTSNFYKSILYKHNSHIRVKKTINSLEMSHSEPKKYTYVDVREYQDDGFRIRERELAFHYIPTKDQKFAVNSIISKYIDSHDRVCVCYISGAPGSGKSTVGAMAAVALDGRLCYDYNPTRSTNPFSTFYDAINPTPEHPLICVIDEIDMGLRDILKFEENKKQIVMIADTSAKSASEKNKAQKKYPIIRKDDWTFLFDRIGCGMYPNIIIIMTSNHPPDVFDTEDASLLRVGRINLRLRMETPIGVI